MNHYLDIISRNHTLSEFSDYSSSEPSSPKQKGGNKEIFKTKATGCFPPIYKLKPEDIEKEKEKDKSRAFAQVKTSLSIKSILENRRKDDTQSFIAL
jgi:hypothetical protein